MFRRFAPWGLVCALATSLAGCEQGELTATEMDVEEADLASLMRTNYYYISNPVATSGGCANALKLTAKGSGITSVTPVSGCWIDQLGPSPTWDSLTSPGTTLLADTWYMRGSAFDKDNTSANNEAWCGPDDLVVVKVVGTTITSLTYWFTDDWDCFF